MQVSCQTLHVYCDAPDCPKPWEGGIDQPGTFTGETAGECRKEARAAGWRLRTGEPDLCPVCNGKQERRTRGA